MTLLCGCELIYECSRCIGCYAHQHKAIYNEKLERWQWRCSKTNQIVKVILEKSPLEKGYR